jgi:hypothetical protein
MIKSPTPSRCIRWHCSLILRLSGGGYYSRSIDREGQRSRETLESSKSPSSPWKRRGPDRFSWIGHQSSLMRRSCMRWWRLRPIGTSISHVMEHGSILLLLLQKSRDTIVKLFDPGQPFRHMVMMVVMNADPGPPLSDPTSHSSLTLSASIMMGRRQVAPSRLRRPPRGA